MYNNSSLLKYLEYWYLTQDFQFFYGITCLRTLATEIGYQLALGDVVFCPVPHKWWGPSTLYIHDKELGWIKVLPCALSFSRFNFSTYKIKDCLAHIIDAFPKVVVTWPIFDIVLIYYKVPGLYLVFSQRGAVLTVTAIAADELRLLKMKMLSEPKIVKEPLS